MTRYLAKRMRRWPTPAGWPRIVQRITHEVTFEEYAPSRRRAWLLWRLVCVQLSGHQLEDHPADTDIEAAVRTGAKRIGDSATRAARAESHPGDVHRRDVLNAFAGAVFAIPSQSERSNHVPAHFS